MLVAITFVLVGLLLYFLYKRKWHKNETLINKIPGPPVSLFPWIGNTHQLVGISLADLWSIFRKFNNIYYPVFRVWSFETCMIGIRHPDDIEVLLSSTKNITKSKLYDFLKPWLKDGLLTNTGAKWKNRRKMLTPAFHFSILNKFVEVIAEQSEQMVQTIKKNTGETEDLTALLSQFTLNTICQTSMGIQLEEDFERRKNYQKAIFDMGNMIFHRIVNPWLRQDWIFPWTSLGRLQANALKILHGFSTDIIERRKKYHEENTNTFADDFINNKIEKANQQDETPGVDRKRVALLDLLIQVWKCGGIDDAGIREEVDTFIFEGHDTTAAALTFAVLLLAEHKDIQERARIEINEAFETYGSRLGMAGLQSLVYLERCIKESLRLYPSVSQISRVTTEDMELKNYLIPKNSEIAVFIFDLHRDPNFWPNPEVYDPDRFLPENIRTRHPFSYIPFSAGPRNCIGQKFAMMELKSFIASLLFNFHLEPIDIANETRLIMDLVIRPMRPVKVKFIPIK